MHITYFCNNFKLVGNNKKKKEGKKWRRKKRLMEAEGFFNLL